MFSHKDSAVDYVDSNHMLQQEKKKLNVCQNVK